MNNTRLLKKILFVLGNDCQFPREYFKKIAKKLRKDRVYSSSRNFLSKYQQSNHIRRNSQKFKIGKHSRKNKYSRSSSNSDSASSKNTSGSSSRTSSKTSDSEEISSGEDLKVNQNINRDETQSEANNLTIDSDCIDLKEVSGYKLIDKKNANRLNFLQQKNENKQEKKKGNELIFQKQKMLNLYSYKSSGSKFSNDMASNTSSTNSYASNHNTINASHTTEPREVVGDGECLKNSKFVNVLNDNKLDILENRKSKKLKTNLIDRFNRNREAEECENKMLNDKNQVKMLNDRVKTFFYSLIFVLGKTQSS